MLSRSLSLKIAAVGAITVAVAFGLSTFLISRQTSEAFGRQNTEIQLQTAQNQAARVRERLDLAAQTAHEAVTTLAAMRAHGVTDRSLYDQTLRASLIANPEVLGLWSGWEPEALDGQDAAYAGAAGYDGSGRFIPYWNRATGNITRDALEGYDEAAYYVLPKQNKRMIAIEPYSYHVGGKDMLMMTFGAPIEVDGKYYGSGGVDISLDALNTEIAAQKPFGTGFVTVVSTSGIAVSYPEAGVIGKPLKDKDPASAQVAAQAINTGKMATTDAKASGGNWRYLALPVAAGKTKEMWAVVVAVPVATLNAEVNKNNTILLILSVVSIGAAVLILFFMLRQMVGTPLKGLGRTLERMASGDHNAEVPEARRLDEIGQIGKAVLRFRDSLRERATADAEAAHAREVQEAEARKATMQQLANEFEHNVSGIVGQVATASIEMRNSAEALSMIAANASGQTTTIASATEQAANNVRTVAAASEELTSSINEITSKAEASSTIARRAVEEANRSDDRIRELEAAASKVGEVVTLIQAIAQQTNLLALNATIEAARAGDAGKGFAVVATEVKSLANQTAKATEEIGEQITAIQSATGGTVEAIASIRDIIHEMSQFSLAISAAMTQQGAATDDIARNVHEASQGTDEVARHIHGLASATQETGEASSRSLTTADQLVRQSEVLKSQVQAFVDQVRHG